MILEDFEFEKVPDGYAIVRYNGKVEDVIVPDTYHDEPVVRINERAFRSRNMNSNNMRSLFIPDTVTIIGDNAFNFSTHLESIRLPQGLTVIPDHTFSHCRLLKECILPESLQEIDVFSFWGCESLEEITIPTSVKVVKNKAFSDCMSLRKVNCENEEVIFHQQVFYACGSLEELPLFIWKYLKLFSVQMENLLLYRKSIWDDCNLKEKKVIISFVKRDKALKEYLFIHGDSALASFLFREKVTLTLDEVNHFLDQVLNSKSTQSNTLKTAILLDYKNKNFSRSVIESHMLNKEQVKLGLVRPTLQQFREKWRCSKVKGGLRVYAYKGKEKEEFLHSELADGTKILVVGHAENVGFQPLRKITLEEGIVTLEEHVFLYCSTLKEIILPEGLSQLEPYRVSACFSLKKVVIPSSVKVLVKNAIDNCENLEEVVVSKETKVEEGALLQCPLAKIIVK